MAALPVEHAAVSAVSPVTGQIPSGWKEKFNLDYKDMINEEVGNEKIASMEQVCLQITRLKNFTIERRDLTNQSKKIGTEELLTINSAVSKRYSTISKCPFCAAAIRACLDPGTSCSILPSSTSKGFLSSLPV